MRRPSVALVLSGLALLVARSGGAFAAGVLVTSKDIKDHTIQLRDLSPAAIKALRGQKGDPGPAGQQGPRGAQGAQGPQGPKGSFDPAKIKAYDSPLVDVPSGQFGEAVAECPAGSVVISGGYSQGADHTIWNTTLEQPLLASSPNAYKVRGYNPSTVTIKLLAYAVCATP